MTQTVEIARFSRYPAGRHRSDGPATGEAFRDDVLIPALREGPVVVILDGVAGLPSSFLEEVFGGLIRQGFHLADLQKNLTLVAESARMRGYDDQIWRLIREAAARFVPAA